MKQINWGDHVYYNGRKYRVVEVDLGKKNFSLCDENGSTLWVSRDDLMESVVEIDIKNQKEAKLP